MAIKLSISCSKLPHVLHGLPSSLSKENTALFRKAVRAGDQRFQEHYRLNQSENLLNSALDMYTLALEMNPDDPVLKAKMARVYLKQGHCKKAQKIAFEMLAANKPSMQAIGAWILGFIAYQREDDETAEYNFKKAIDACFFSKHLFQTGQLYRQLARLSFRKAGKNSTLLQKGNILLQACFYFLLSVLLSPLSLAASFPDLESAYPPAYYFQLLPGLAYVNFLVYCRKHDQALPVMRALYKRYPGTPALMVRIGDIYFLQGKARDAELWYRRTLAKDPIHEECYLKLARLQEMEGNFSAARESYEKLHALYPEDAMLHCRLGNTFYIEERYEETLFHYQAALHLSPDQEWKALMAKSIGKIYYEQLNDPDMAAMAFQQAIQLCPSDLENYLHLGSVYFEQEKYPAADIIYRKAIRIDPENAQLYTALAYIKWMTDQVDEAISLYEQALHLDTQSHMAYNNLGVIYLDSLGNIIKAIELFETAIRLDSSYALGHFNLGRALSMMNRRSEAALCFQKAKTLNESTQELDQDDLNQRIYNIFET